MSRTRGPRDSYILDAVKGETPFAFIPHPDQGGLWLRVHPCVVLVPCPECKVPAGTPCYGAKGKAKGKFMSAHHYRRANAVPRHWHATTERERVIVLRRAAVSVYTGETDL